MSIFFYQDHPLRATAPDLTLQEEISHLADGNKTKNSGCTRGFQRGPEKQTSAADVGIDSRLWQLHEPGTEGQCGRFQTIEFDADCRHQV